MKSLLCISISFSIVILLFCTACEEEGPYINFDPVDTSLFDTTFISTTSVSPMVKKVLIEDFTGARCPNCPNAAAKLTEISIANPGRIVGMAIHPKGIPFTVPHDQDADYRTDDGTIVFSILNEGPLPIGGIDRVLFAGESNILVRIDVWNSYVDQQLLIGSPVNIELTSTAHKIEANTYVIRAEVHYTIAVNDKNYLTIALTESDLISPQTLPSSTVDSNYIHNHVLRDIISNPVGNLLMDSPELNRVFIKEFTVKLDDHWDPDNCSVVGFVHYSASQFNVLQVEEIHLK
ncbi:MAG: Omp28-related outer membrane protein [Bacteroidetes bacterium]|nr:Omp28-related outer membrane protein [Bacteroidota bacterium]